VPWAGCVGLCLVYALAAAGWPAHVGARLHAYSGALLLCIAGSAIGASCLLWARQG
jgi:hypothetical protein